MLPFQQRSRARPAKFTPSWAHHGWGKSWIGMELTLSCTAMLITGSAMARPAGEFRFTTWPSRCCRRRILPQFIAYLKCSGLVALKVQRQKLPQRYSFDGPVEKGAEPTVFAVVLLQRSTHCLWARVWVRYHHGSGSQAKFIERQVRYMAAAFLAADNRP